MSAESECPMEGVMGVHTYGKDGNGCIYCGAPEPEEEES